MAMVRRTMQDQHKSLLRKPLMSLLYCVQLTSMSLFLMASGCLQAEVSSGCSQATVNGQCIDPYLQLRIKQAQRAAQRAAQQEPEIQLPPPEQGVPQAVEAARAAAARAAGSNEPRITITPEQLEAARLEAARKAVAAKAGLLPGPKPKPRPDPVPDPIEDAPTSPWPGPK